MQEIPDDRDVLLLTTKRKRKGFEGRKGDYKGFELVPIILLRF